jgi:predicted nucleic acid-binding protein
VNILADNSIFVAVLLNEPTKARIIELTRDKAALAPHSLPYEVANAISKLARRRLLSPGQASATWELWTSMPVQLRDFDMAAAVRVAATHGIYAYDAFVLQCALEASVPLFTLDKRLQVEAKKLGIALLE